MTPLSFSCSKSYRYNLVVNRVDLMERFSTESEIPWQEDTVQKYIKDIIFTKIPKFWNKNTCTLKNVTFYHACNIFCKQKQFYYMLDKSPINEMFYQRVTVKQSIYKVSFKKMLKTFWIFKEIRTVKLGWTQCVFQ